MRKHPVRQDRSGETPHGQGKTSAQSIRGQPLRRDTLQIEPDDRAKQARTSGQAGKEGADHGK